MSARILGGLFGIIVLVAVVVFVRTRVPPLPRAEAHCASGIGGTALCSEWAGTLDAEKQLCQKLEGSWAEQPCPTDVSAAGGTCVVRTPAHTGTIRYGSAWRDRARAHCEKHGGTYTPR